VHGLCIVTTKGKNKRAKDKGNEIRMNVWLKRDKGETEVEQKESGS